MSEQGGGRSGGIDVSGTMNSGGGDITGRDKIVGAPPAGALEDSENAGVVGYGEIGVTGIGS